MRGKMRKYKKLLTWVGIALAMSLGMMSTMPKQNGYVVQYSGLPTTSNGKGAHITGSISSPGYYEVTLWDAFDHPAKDVDGKVISPIKTNSQGKFDIPHVASPPTKEGYFLKAVPVSAEKH